MEYENNKVRSNFPKAMFYNLSILHRKEVAKTHKNIINL